jgi:hypothetical protein
MSNPCTAQWREFLGVGVLIGGLCAVWAEIIWRVFFSKNRKINPD